MLHQRRGDVALSARAIDVDRIQRREGLIAEFGAETRNDVVVSGEGLAAVPYQPVVHIALERGFVVIHRAVARRAGPEGAGRIALLDCLADCPVQTVVVDRQELASLLRIPVDGARDFVVAAPERDARMVAQTLHLILDLLADESQKMRERGIVRTGEHAVVPDQNAELVAEFIEIFVLILSAAPDAEHVHIGFHGIRKNLVVTLAGETLRHGVHRNPVRPLAEDVDAVDTELHRPPDFVVLVDKRKRAETDLLFQFFVGSRNREFIEILLSVADGIPEFRVPDLK